MRAGLISSTMLHGGVLAFMLVSFSSAKPFEVPEQSASVDIVSSDELSEMMAGKKTAPKAEKPKPVVEKVGPAKPPENLEAPVTDKPEVKAANEPPPPPPPPPPAPQAKAPDPTPPPPQVKPPEPKPEPKPPVAEAKPTPPPPPDAEALKSKPPEAKPDPKPDQQPEQKVAQIPPPPPPSPPKKPPPPKPVVQAPPREQDQKTFDTNQIAALLDKRTPSRQAAIGDTINNTASLGAATGTAARLSQSEIDALRARLMSLWSPPAGAANPEELIVTVRIRLNSDGTLSAPPQVMNSGQSTFFMSARESAIRAIFRGQPFNMLSPAKYESWKDIEITFDPRDMLRG